MRKSTKLRIFCGLMILLNFLTSVIFLSQGKEGPYFASGILLTFWLLVFINAKGWYNEY